MLATLGQRHVGVGRIADQLAAALLADRTRADIGLALLDHRTWTIGEPARLVDGGLVTAVRQGRSRYVRLAAPRGAGLLEDFCVCGIVRSPEPAVVGSPREATTLEAMARARTCYDHLAGRLGVRITDAMTPAVDRPVSRDRARRR